MNSRFYPYATDSGEREVLAYYFAVIAVALAYGIYKLIEAFHLQMPWWLAVPTPMGLYLILRWWFSNYLWRWELWRKLRIVKIPDLNGEYRGHLWTSHDGHEETHACEFTITQTWTAISIRGRFPQSRSFNGVTGITVEGTDAPRLTYEYFNEPSSGAVESMNPHRGTIWFDIIAADDQIRLEGEYYTGRGRETSGTITAATGHSPI